jgi:thiamine monophosphate kinase
MSKNVELDAHGVEFAAIRELIARWGTRAEGIGDDAAVTRLPRGDALVASVDTSIEGRHFRRDWLLPREIGYRAVAAALSDLAAMAARPFGILVALALPPAWRDVLPEIADGISDAVDLARAKILGGNLSAAGGARCVSRFRRRRRTASRVESSDTIRVSVSRNAESSCALEVRRLRADVRRESTLDESAMPSARSAAKTSSPGIAVESGATPPGM